MKKLLFGLILLITLFLFFGCTQGSVCSNGTCEAGENHKTCPQDCNVTVVSPTQTLSSITKEKTVDVTPVVNGSKIVGHRPDVVNIGGKLYLMYDESDQLSLVVLDSNLNQLSFTRGLSIKSSGNPMDIRTFTDGTNLGYGVEVSPRVPPCECTNKLDFVLYAPQNLETPVFSKSGIATGCPGAMLRINNCSSTLLNSSFATDDPAPFYFNSMNCIATRKNTGAELNIYCFDSLGVQKTFTSIDLSAVVVSPKNFSQNAVVVLDGTPWVIGGADNGPLNNGTGSIYAIPLSTQLNSIDGETKEIIPSVNGEYNTRVVAARAYGNYVIFTYLNRANNGNSTTTYIAGFDYKNNFNKVAEAIILDHSVADDHMPMEIIGDKAIVFHQENNSDSSIIAEVYSLK